MAQANGFSWRLITENTEEKLLDFSVNVNPRHSEKAYCGLG